MTKIRSHWFPLLLVLCALIAITPYLVVFAQVSPQIQGSGAPSNPCNNGGQQYVDQTNHVLYSCPSSGGTWVNIGLGAATSNGLTNNGSTLTATQPILFPDGTNSAPSMSFANQTNLGWFRPSSNRLGLAGTSSNGERFAISISAGGAEFLLLPTGGTYGFISGGTTDGASPDSGISRDAAAVVDVGNGTSQDTTGKLKAAGLISVGATFTASGCANSTLVGGATAGTYKSVTGGSCTVTVTMGNSATSPNGWACDAHDLTTVADANNITLGSSNTTTANLVEGTVVANDIIAFKCVGY